MSWTIDGLILLPAVNLTEGRFSTFMSQLGVETDSWVPEWTPNLPDAPLLSTVFYPQARLSGIELGFDSSFSGKRGVSVELPDGLAYLRVFADQGQFVGDLGNQNRFYKLLKQFFLEFGGIYGVVDHEFLFEDRLTFREFMKVQCAIHMFSSELVDAVGHEEFEFPDKFGDGGDPRWLRSAEDFYNGLPTHFVFRLQRLLGLVRERYDFTRFGGEDGWAEEDIASLTEEREEVQGREAPNKLVVADCWNLFFVLFYPEENHTEVNCRELVTGLVDEEAGTEKGKDRFPIKVTNLFHGYMSINHSFYDKKDPPFRTRNLTATCLTLSGTGLFKFFGPEFQCDGHRCILILTSKRGTVPMVEYERDFLDVIQRFSRTFGATFGFGHYHYEDFARTYEELGSFTDRLWPINLFSEEGGGPGVVSGVERFARLSGERWKCAPLSDTRAILSFEPIDVRPEMIPARWRQMLLEEWSDELPP